MGITRLDELRNSPAARDKKSFSQIIVIIIRSLNNILLNKIRQILFFRYFCIHFQLHFWSADHYFNLNKRYLAKFLT
jgi:hypothetical protein